MMKPPSLSRATSNRTVYDYVSTPWEGVHAFIVVSPDGLCALQFGIDVSSMVQAARRVYGDVTPTPPGACALYTDQIHEYLAGVRTQFDFPLDLHGTPFQQRVWAALQQIPYGSVRTYEEVAAAIGSPKAVRAVGSACGANPIALVIPCHRVVRKDGRLGGYAWGLSVKAALLALEKR